MGSGGGAGFGEIMTGEALVGSVQPAANIEEPACLVNCLRRGVQTRVDLQEIASRHQLYGGDEASDQDIKTTTWRCPQDDCRAEATAVIDDSDPNGKVVSLEFPSKVPAVPNVCAEDPSASINTSM
ncbi:MAG: hypothetical protein JWM81_1060 [Candidatus Saccharibacteria bacterium]|nr:hypothetical protein [Candidatus Saccharibacteria bacterium]